jgi:subtilisin family serine protease
MKISSKIIYVGAFLASAGITAPAFSQFFDEAPAAEPATLIVKYARGTFSNPQSRDFEIQRFLSSPEVRTLGHLGSLDDLQERTQLVRFSSNLDPAVAAETLSQNEAVEWAQPNYYLYAVEDFFTGSSGKLPTILGGMRDIFEDDDQPAKDPDYVTPPDLPGQRIADPRNGEAWGLKAVDAEGAWQISSGSREVVVADIDTGVDYTHEDLVNNMWINPRPTQDDRHGYDFANRDSRPYDDHSHGTHTSGTIGATGGNGIGLSGVARDVSIMALKFLTGGGSGTTANAVLAIDYAIANGARVMSNSWGGRGSGSGNRALEDAIVRANKADILFVAAAGNDASDNDVSPTYPAAIKQPNMLTVAATTQTDQLASFSNFGKTTVHVGAPGAKVLSTVPGNQYKAFSGTSMACPHVAGLAALILAVNPKLSAVKVKEIIMETVDPLPALNGITVSGGRVNAKKALERARLGSFGFDI